MEAQMTFNYDDTDEDAFAEDLLDQEADEEAATALSQAFREATAAEIEDEESIEEDIGDAEDKDDKDDKEAEDKDEEASNAEAAGDTDDSDADAEADAQRLIEPIEPLPDEDDDSEEELTPVELPPTEPAVALFRPTEQSNYAYADAVTAYYEEKDYQRAIEKFSEAIEYEAQSTENNGTDANEIVAKSKYWQAEAYIKLQDLRQAILTFEDLLNTCQEHYLSLAAQRRLDQLNAEHA